MNVSVDNKTMNHPMAHEVTELKRLACTQPSMRDVSAPRRHHSSSSSKLKSNRPGIHLAKKVSSTRVQKHFDASGNPRSDRHVVDLKRTSSESSKKRERRQASSRFTESVKELNFTALQASSDVDEHSGRRGSMPLLMTSSGIKNPRPREATTRDYTSRRYSISGGFAPTGVYRASRKSSSEPRAPNSRHSAGRHTSEPSRQSSAVNRQHGRRHRTRSSDSAPPRREPNRRASLSNNLDNRGEDTARYHDDKPVRRSRRTSSNARPRRSKSHATQEEFSSSQSSMPDLESLDLSSKLSPSNRTQSTAMTGLDALDLSIDTESWDVELDEQSAAPSKHRRRPSNSLPLLTDNAPAHPASKWNKEDYSVSDPSESTRSSKENHLVVTDRARPRRSASRKGDGKSHRSKSRRRGHSARDDAAAKTATKKGLSPSRPSRRSSRSTSDRLNASLTALNPTPSHQRRTHHRRASVSSGSSSSLSRRSQNHATPKRQKSCDHSSKSFSSKSNRGNSRNYKSMGNLNLDAWDFSPNSIDWATFSDAESKHSRANREQSGPFAKEKDVLEFLTSKPPVKGDDDPSFHLTNQFGDFGHDSLGSSDKSFASGGAKDVFVQPKSLLGRDMMDKEEDDKDPWGF